MGDFLSAAVTLYLLIGIAITVLPLCAWPDGFWDEWKKLCQPEKRQSRLVANFVAMTIYNFATWPVFLYLLWKRLAD